MSGSTSAGYDAARNPHWCNAIQQEHAAGAGCDCGSCPPECREPVRIPQVHLLGQALGRILVAAGVARETPLTGPQLLLLADDYAACLEASSPKETIAVCCVCDADPSDRGRLVWTGRWTPNGRRICRLLCAACWNTEREDAVEQATGGVA